MDKNIIEARKTYNRIANQSKQKAKQQECLWCHKPITRFCNSHSVPEFVLRNIEQEGMVDYFNTIAEIPLINEDRGLSEAGTFKLICRDCDGKIFQNYENPDKICLIPSEQMLEEIALKNMLLYLNKRFYEEKLYETLKEQFNSPFPYEAKEEVTYLDVRDFLWDYHRIKDLIDAENNEEKFKLIFWKKLPYKVPMAFQGPISLYGDLEGEIVEDIYNKAEDKIIKHLHICIFPLESESVVFAFYHVDDFEYDNFAEQLKSLPDEELLDVIAYIIFQNSEDMLLSKRIPHRTYFYRKVQEVFSETSEILAFSLVSLERQMREKRMSLKYRKNYFPKILSEKYAIKQNTN